MRVVIAEDLVLLRESMARMLTAHGVEVVAEVGDSATLLAAVVAERPDVVVTDVRMPPTFTDEGARAALLIRERFPDTGMVVLSHIIEPTVALALAAPGADRFGYLLKDSVLGIQAFIDVLEDVHAGGTVIDQDVVSYLLDAAANRSIGGLTPREREVLALVAQGLTNAAIASRLVVSERTIDAHMRSTFAKLGLEPNDEHHRRVRAVLAWLQESLPLGEG